jgi:uncharacterized protein with PQ loop repeat
MLRFKEASLALLLLSLVILCSCEDLVPRDTSSLLIPRFHWSEILGFVAGFGTTFAALPDLIAMLRRRSSAGMNPRIVAIMGVFQILWVYYRLANCVTTGNRMERNRGLYQFSECGLVFAFRTEGKETRNNVS